MYSSGRISMYSSGRIRHVQENERSLQENRRRAGKRRGVQERGEACRKEERKKGCK